MLEFVLRHSFIRGKFVDGLKKQQNHALGGVGNFRFGIAGGKWAGLPPKMTVTCRRNFVPLRENVRFLPFPVANGSPSSHPQPRGKTHLQLFQLKDDIPVINSRHRGSTNYTSPTV